MVEFFYYNSEILIFKFKKIQIKFIFEFGEIEWNLDFYFFSFMF